MDDKPLLSLIALSASQCLNARSAEMVLDAILGASAPVKDDPQEELWVRYPEVCLLRQIHFLRCALRNLQECPPHARRTFYMQLHEHLTDLSKLLPDLLFIALTKVVATLLDSPQGSEAPLGKERCHVLEVQLIRLIEVLQTELLRDTKQLTQRTRMISLYFHHCIPFL